MQTTTNQTTAFPPTAHSAAASVASTRFVTIKQAALIRTAFTEAALRDIRFKAFDRENSRGEVIKGNGSGEFGCWLQLGGKVLLDLDRFDAWLQSHKAAATSRGCPQKPIAKTVGATKSDMANCSNQCNSRRRHLDSPVSAGSQHFAGRGSKQSSIGES